MPTSGERSAELQLTVVC